MNGSSLYLLPMNRVLGNQPTWGGSPVSGSNPGSGSSGAVRAMLVIRDQNLSHRTAAGAILVDEALRLNHLDVPSFVKLHRLLTIGIAKHHQATATVQVGEQARQLPVVLAT